MKKKKQKSRKKKFSKVPSSLKSSFLPRREKTKHELPSKKPPSRFDSERMNRVIARLMNGHDFKSDEEAERFIQTQIIGKNLDEILELTDFDPVEEAQEHAYEAMETEDPFEALELTKKALQLDPDCVDAFMLMARLTSRSLTEKIKKVKRIIARTEQKLGKNYFEENRGHFWGLVETRPYMRARSFLVSALRKTGKTAEAIHQAEEMLELNPNDNQGIRDTLLGMYLETGNLDGARILFEKYPTEFMAVFLWGQVLERYLSGDLKKAARIYRRASERNPYMLDYLTGRKRPSSELKDFYSPGDESEAIFCLEEIGPAWQKHPEAIEWLKSLQ